MRVPRDIRADEVVRPVVVGDGCLTAIDPTKYATNIDINSVVRKSHLPRLRQLPERANPRIHTPTFPAFCEVHACLQRPFIVSTPIAGTLASENWRHEGGVVVDLPDALAASLPTGDDQDAITADRDLTDRARSFLSTTPRPFLKWAGSKRWLLPHLVPLLPRTFGTYREPFLGSAALFFLLRPERAVLGDTCTELVQTFEAVRDNQTAVLRFLHPLKPKKTVFYEIRKKRSTGRFRRAAEFIYLNKTCWNGLYRVNSSGVFNVPYGKPNANGIVDDDNLKACADLLSRPGVQLRSSDFEAIVSEAQRGDLVYLDPPYVTGHSNNGFIDYNEKLFAWEDQQRLATAAAELDRRGVHVIVTNADHAEIHKLYPNFDRLVVERRSTLAGTMSARRPVREVIIHNLPRVGTDTNSSMADGSSRARDTRAEAKS